MTARGLVVGRHTFSGRSLALHALAPLAFVGSYLVAGVMQVAVEALVAASLTSLLLGLVLERRVLALPLVMGCLGIVTALLAADPRPWQRMFCRLANCTASCMTRKKPA